MLNTEHVAPASKLSSENIARLYEAAQALAAQPNLPVLLQATVALGQQLADASSAVLYIAEAENPTLKISTEVHTSVEPDLPQKLMRDLAIQAAKSGQAVSLRKVPESAAAGGTSPARQFHAQPLIYNDQVTGVLIAVWANPAVAPEQCGLLLERFATSTVIILDKMRTLDRVHQRLSQIELMQTSRMQFEAAATVEDVLRILLDNTLAHLSLTAGSIWLYDPAYDELVRAEFRGVHRQLPARNKTAVGAVGKVFVTGEPYPAREFKTGPLDPERHGGSGQANWGGLCVPLKVGSEVMGVMFITTQLPRELNPLETKLIIELSQNAAQTLQKSQQAVEPNRRVQRLDALRTIDTAIATSLELPVILNVILDQVLARLSVNAAVVMLLNPENQTLEYAAGRGFYTDGVTRIRLRLSDGFLVKRRAPITVDFTREDNLPVRSALLASEKFVVYFTVPLIARGVVKGALEIYHRDRMDPDTEWYEFLEALSAQAAIAIDNATLFAELRRSNLELAMAYEATLEGWSKALELRDRETEGHTRRVTEMTMKLSRQMKIPEADLVQMRRGALLHDIGKMGIPDSILLKPGPLTDDEMTVMSKHPKYAYDMLSSISYLLPALDIPYGHHEKWDGTGYPRGLKGEQIPLAARIFSIVDVWDALRFDRPYRAQWPEAEVRDYIRSLSGKHFDPQVVEAFFICLEDVL